MPWPYIGNPYTCTAKPLFDGQNDNKLTVVYGTHQSGKEYVDVEGLYIPSENMQFFPINIETFFSNLRGISFSVNSMSDVSNNHLIPFPNLEVLALNWNRITSLDSNLLAGLKLIEYIDFNSNNIKHVGHDFILPNQGEIYFWQNPCIDRSAITVEEINYLRFSLLVNFSPTISQIETTLVVLI